MDKKAGEIIVKLKSAGSDTNTLVILTAENPTPEEIFYYANGKRVQGSKTQTRESGTRVPLITYMPGHIAANSINDDLIDFTDFFPIFARLAKVSNSSLQQYGFLDRASYITGCLIKGAIGHEPIFLSITTRIRAAIKIRSGAGCAIKITSCTIQPDKNIR